MDIDQRQRLPQNFKGEDITILQVEFKFQRRLSLALLSVFGALLSILADYYTGFSSTAPVNSILFNLKTVENFGSFKTLPELQAGHYLIILSFPIMYTGIVHIFSGISQTHLTWIKKLFFVSFTLAFFWAFTFHFTITFTSFLFIKIKQGALAVSQTDMSFVSGLFNFATGVMSIAFFTANACFFILVFFSKTNFPRYVAIFNPLLISLGFSTISQFLPSPYAQFFYITAMNWGLFIWLSLSLIVFRKLPVS